MSESELGNGNGRSSTALTTLKMAVLAPMPSASAIVATMLRLGDFHSIRSPYRISCQNVPMVLTSLSSTLNVSTRNSHIRHHRLLTFRKRQRIEQHAVYHRK